MYIERQTDRQTDRERQTDRQRERERDTHRQTARERASWPGKTNASTKEILLSHAKKKNTRCVNRYKDQIGCDSIFVWGLEKAGGLAGRIYPTKKIRKPNR